MLKGKKVAAVVTDGYHNTELWDPMKALQDEGVQVEVIGVKPEHLDPGVLDHETWRLPDDMKPKERTRAAKLIGDAASDDYDALLVPGGFSPERLRPFPEVVAFVQDIYAAGKPIAAICHGAQILIEAGIVRGKTMTCVPTISVDLINAGAIYLDRPLVIDGTFVTSRTPADMEHFNRGFKQVLSG